MICSPLTAAYIAHASIRGQPIGAASITGSEYGIDGGTIPTI